MSGFAPTAEQQIALDLFKTGKSLAIEAGAGAGKTSTLLLLANSTNRRGQYIAFNKAIVTEAGEKMPKNVAASTAHSLAYRNVIPGTRYAQRLRNSRRMPSDQIATAIGIREAITVRLPDGETKRLTRGRLAGIAMRGVTRFCQSADLEPEARHVPYIDGIDLPPGARVNNAEVAKALVPAMRKAWADITAQDGALPFRHDHYLKIWHLSGPKINADFILFDEAQDANPVLVDIVKQQTHAQLVWVGDSQQSIYGFTGAVNALQEVGADQQAFLTQSFRFGPAIAAIANRCLDSLNADLRLTGTDSIPSRVEPIARPTVLLTRTNAAAVKALLNEIADGRRPHLVGGGRDVIDFAKGAKKLMTEGWTEHPELGCFQSWDEVLEYVSMDEQGGELRLMTKLIEEFGVDRILAALERMPAEEDADLVISTAHKSKGREWDNVQLADDFPAEPADEEMRLLYVACTRAKLRLDITAVKVLTEGGYYTGETIDLTPSPEVVEVLQAAAENATAASEDGDVAPARKARVVFTLVPDDAHVLQRVLNGETLDSADAARAARLAARLEGLRAGLAEVQ